MKSTTDNFNRWESSRLLWTLTMAVPLFFLLSLGQTQAGSATWNLDPTSGDWNTAPNWTPRTVPNGESDIATFATSDRTAISLSSSTTVDRIVFAAGASQFTITVPSPWILFLAGVGVVNDSGAEQNFVSPQFGTVRFLGNSVASPLTTFTNLGDQLGNFGGGSTEFFDTASAGSAGFVNQSGLVEDGFGGTTDFHTNATAATSTIVNQGANLNIAATGGETDFFESSAAGQAVIVSEAGLVSGAPGGLTRFFATSRAIKATIIAHGSALMGAGGGQTIFFDSSSADRATLIADGGTQGTFGGLILFSDTSTGGSAIVQLSDYGRLDISLDTNGSVSVGSIEGDGNVLLGGNTLAVGRNNLSTSFAGKIRDGGIGHGTGGSLTKEGRGVLTLSETSSYTGGTMVNDGVLLIRRRNATGTGAIQVNAGTLGGDSAIPGAVTLGSASGTGTFLSPGGNGVDPETLTIANTLTFNFNASYRFGINSDTARADEIVAAGVTINGGATFTAAVAGASALSQGTILIAIDNTAATPIAGTFGNLPDGAVITVGKNHLEANYEGGDGNDLALTVVP